MKVNYPEKLAQRGFLNTTNFVTVKKLPQRISYLKYFRNHSLQEVISMKVAIKVYNLLSKSLGLDVFQIFFRFYKCNVLHLPLLM